MRFNTEQQRQHGISLVECAVAVAVAAITLSTAAPGFASFIEKRRIDGVAAQLAADIHFARSEAARRQATVRLSLKADANSSCWIVHTGAARDCRCDATGNPVCDAGLEALKATRLPAGERIVVSGNVASMLFDPLHGTSTPAGTLKVSGASGRAVQHVVNVMGRVRTCSPQGAAPALAGYRVC